MYAYRISREKFASDLTGEGARRFGGRWNKKGDAVLYCSSSISLATLEVLVHVPQHIAPEDLLLTTLFIPNELTLEWISEGQLPNNWRIYPAPSILAKMGSNWIIKEETAILKVPSGIIPTEYNFLINPRHIDFSQIRTEKVEEFKLDSRLFG